MKHFIFPILLLLLTIGTGIDATAQQPGGPGNREMPAIGKLRGNVTDGENNQPVEYATVALMSVKDSSVVTGGITDDKGNFSISEIKLGAYLVKINFMGYEPLFVGPVMLSPRSEKGIEQNLGYLKIMPAQTKLQEVEITAEKEIFVNEIDRKVFNVSKNLTTDGASANEIMQNIPSVNVDQDGNISLRGSQNVTILIDGKPSGLTGASRQALLEQLPAASIEAVEIITNPSAKYDPDGMSGIINIVLKKNKLQGFNGSITLQAGTGDKYNASGNLSVRTQKVNLFANYGWRDDKRWGEGSSYRSLFTENGTSILDQDERGDRSFGSHMIRGGLDFYLTEDKTLSASATYNTNEQNSPEQINYRNLNAEKILESTSVRTNKRTGNGNSTDLNMSYVQQFGSRQHSLTLDARHSFSDGTNQNGFSQSFFLSDGNPDGNAASRQNNFSNDNNRITSISADYMRPLGEKGKMETGYKSIIRRMNQDFRSESFDPISENFVTDLNLSNNFEYDEQIHAVYGTYGQNFGKLGVQAGLRAEQVYTMSYLVTTNERFENNYFSLFPSLHLKYDLGKQNELMLGYSRRINRPNTWFLNPFTDYSDPLNLRKGNPFLLPEYTNSFDLGYGRYRDKVNITASLYYRHTTDAMSRLKTVEDTGISTTTFANFSTEKSYGLEFIFNGKPIDIWDFTLSSNFYRSEIDGSELAPELTNSAYAFSAKLMTSVNLKKGPSIQFSANYQAPRPVAQGTISEIYTTDLALKQNILKGKGSINLRLSDLFDTQRFSFQTSGNNFDQSSYRKRESRIFYAGITFNFGKMEMRKQRGRREGGGEGGGGGMEGGID